MRGARAYDGAGLIKVPDALLQPGHGLGVLVATQEDGVDGGEASLARSRGCLSPCSKGEEGEMRAGGTANGEGWYVVGADLAAALFCHSQLRSSPPAPAARSHTARWHLLLQDGQGGRAGRVAGEAGTGLGDSWVKGWCCRPAVGVHRAAGQAHLFCRLGVTSGSPGWRSLPPACCPASRRLSHERVGRRSARRSAGAWRQPSAGR